MDRELLRQYGIDADKGVEHCMGDEAFFQVLLTMFLEDGCFARAIQAKDSGDRKALFACAHELKGVSGNAALSALYTALIPLVELLRTGEPTPEEIDRLFAPVRESYERTCQGIRLAVGG